MLDPDVDYDDARVVVTFTVEHVPEGAADCQGNPEVPYEVELAEPLGDRELVDGACLGDGEASSTSFCRRDGVRWPLPPHGFTQLQSDAASAWDQAKSGRGLRVVNRTAEPVVLTFPDGDRAWIRAGKLVVVLTPCRERFPLLAETKSGDFTEGRIGPCRRRDRWVLSD